MKNHPKTPSQVQLHRDGTVTVWDVYQQQWLRTAHPSAEVLASLNPDTRRVVMAHLGLIAKPTKRQLSVAERQAMFNHSGLTPPKYKWVSSV